MAKKTEKLTPPKDDDRVDIPLHMIRGNMEVLLENHIPCTSVKLNWYGPNGVVLMFTQTEDQKEISEELGFTTRKITTEEFDAE